MRSTRAGSVRGRQGASGPGHDGQTLVEFALVLPIFFTLLIGVIEFALVLNSLLGINFASRDAALVAAEAGNSLGADCAVLRTVQDRVDAPADDNNIIDVTIYRSDTVGRAIPAGSPAQNVYARGGAMTCPVPGNVTATIPFHPVGSIGYLETSRCNTIAGCGPGRPLDHIGVQIRYAYSWHTPLSGLIGLSGNGYTLVKSNAMRMEPVL